MSSNLSLVNAQSGEEYSDTKQIHIVQDAIESLQEEGIPVSFHKISKDSSYKIPFVVECILNSSSKTDQVTCDDPIYFSKVIREINLAQKKGLLIGAVGLSVINAKGELLFEIITAAESNVLVEPSATASLKSADISNLVTQDSILRGMQLGKVEINTKDGFAHCILDLNVTDIYTANEAIPYFMIDVHNVMTDLNNSGAQIVSYQLNLSDANGEILLKFIKDLQFKSSSWWQSEELTEDWFPNPHVLNSSDNKS
jgi:hypothetical protein